MKLCCRSKSHRHNLARFKDEDEEHFSVVSVPARPGIGSPVASSLSAFCSEIPFTAMIASVPNTQHQTEKRYAPRDLTLGGKGDALDRVKTGFGEFGAVARGEALLL
jgi:hypothetical protein